jgi:hypothetical protein
MHTDTIHNSYRPVEHYLYLIESVTGSKPKPVYPIRGLDTYLLHGLAGAYPAALTVIDLTGDATLGALPFFWAAHFADIRHLYSARASWQKTASEWQTWLPAAFESFGIRPEVQTTVEPLLDKGGWEVVQKKLNKLSPVLIVVSGLGDSAKEITERLTWLTSLDKNAVIVVTPVGNTGESPLLQVAGTLFNEMSSHRLTLVREISPFFYPSQMAIIARRENTAVPEALKRIQNMFDGNFGYLGLMESNYKLYQQLHALQNQTMQLSASVNAIVPPPPTIIQNVIQPPPAAQVIAPAALQLKPETAIQRARFFAIRTGRRILRRPEIPHRITYLQATLPRQMRVGQVYEGAVQVRNENRVPWATPAGSTNGYYLSYHWIAQDGSVVVKEGNRSAFPGRVEPSQTITIPFNVATPGTPGQYILELDVVQEGISWFSDAGTAGPRFAVNVET